MPTISKNSLYTLFCPWILDHGVSFVISLSGAKIFISYVLLDLRLRVQRVSLLSRVLPGFRVPHTKGSAGSAACQVCGTSTQKAPSQEPVEQLSKTTIVVESPAGTLERSIFAGYPLGCDQRSLRSGVHCRVAHRGYVVHACARLVKRYDVALFTCWVIGVVTRFPLFRGNDINRLLITTDVTSTLKPVD